MASRKFPLVATLAVGAVMAMVGVSITPAVAATTDCAANAGLTVAFCDNFANDSGSSPGPLWSGKLNGGYIATVGATGPIHLSAPDGNATFPFFYPTVSPIPSSGDFTVSTTAEFGTAQAGGTGFDLVSTLPDNGTDEGTKDGVIDATIHLDSGGSTFSGSPDCSVGIPDPSNLHTYSWAYSGASNVALSIDGALQTTCTDAPRPTQLDIGNATNQGSDTWTDFYDSLVKVETVGGNSGGGGTTTPPTAVPTRYVALGDSFSSGEGNPPYSGSTDKPSDQCHRSDKAYAKRLAAEYPKQWALGANDFVACSGAVVQDIVYGHVGTTHQEGSQLTKLGKDVAQVTLTAGGNDVDFSTVIGDCVYTDAAPLKSFFGTSDCRNVVSKQPNGKSESLYDYEMELINSLGVARACQSEDKKAPPASCGTNGDPSLESLYSQIANKAPNAHIYVLEYPHLFNDTPGTARCDLYGGTIPVILNRRLHKISAHVYISQANINFINRGVDTLDAKIESQVALAKAAGVNVTAVDPRLIWDATPDGQGHGACSRTPWLNGLHLTHTVLKFPAVVSAAPESFHPNKYGHEAFAEAIELARLGSD